MAALTVLGSPLDKGYGPGAGENAAERDDDPRPADARGADDERQRKRERGDEIAGHCSGIGWIRRGRELPCALVF